MKAKTREKIKKITLDVCIVIVVAVLLVGVFELTANAAVLDPLPDLVDPATCSHSFFKGGNPDGYCSKCNYKCQHSNKSIVGYEYKDRYIHNVIYKCNICGLNNVVVEASHVPTLDGCGCSLCELEHFWFVGVCLNCGETCSHDNFVIPMVSCPDCNLCMAGHTYNNDSICIYCGNPCTHDSGTENVYSYDDTHHTTDTLCVECKKCFYSQSNEHIYDSGVREYYADNYCCVSYKCTVCDYSHKEYVSHDFNNGVCSCGYACPHTSHGQNGICNNCLSLVPHNYVERCERYNADLHHWYNECTVCGSIVDHELGYISHNFTDSGSCADCGENCPHSFKGSICDYCGKVCEHTYNGGQCTTCGWACTREDGTVSHSYMYEDKTLTGGFCRFCKYECQHTLGFEWRIYNNSVSHWSEYVCLNCGISFEKTDKNVHTFTYSRADDGCKCSDCGYINAHDFKSDSTFVRREKYSPQYHREYYTYDCCGHTFYKDIEHTFTNADENDFKCTVCGMYSITADNMYNIGYNNGLIDGADMDSGSIAQGMIFGVYDGMTNVFFNMLSYEVFGINIANLIMSLIVIAIVVFIGKKVI